MKCSLEEDFFWKNTDACYFLFELVFLFVFVLCEDGHYKYFGPSQPKNVSSAAAVCELT